MKPNSVADYVRACDLSILPVQGTRCVCVMWLLIARVCAYLDSHSRAFGELFCFLCFPFWLRLFWAYGKIYGQHSLDNCVSAIASGPSWEMQMVRHVRIVCKMPRGAVKKKMGNKWDWKRIKCENVMNYFHFSWRNCPSLLCLFFLSLPLIANGQLSLTSRLVRQPVAACGQPLSVTSWDCF